MTRFEGVKVHIKVEAKYIRGVLDAEVSVSVSIGEDSIWYRAHGLHIRLALGKIVLSAVHHKPGGLELDVKSTECPNPQEILRKVYLCFRKLQHGSSYFHRKSSITKVMAFGGQQFTQATAIKREQCTSTRG
ncbi:hypothetical protein MMC24_002239 [Lignoscripta atroalba]|nr:hypothetical protein [Lignoscripta atroalba]